MSKLSTFSIVAFDPETEELGFNDRKIDLRVDDHDRPIEKLGDLLSLHQLYFSQPSKSDLVELDQNMVRRIQRLLKDLGYYEGPVNGNYGTDTSEVFLEFCRVENFEEKLRDDDLIDSRIIEFMERKVNER